MSDTESLSANQQSKQAAIYMLRTAQQNHVQQIMIADNKASILLAACFIAMSLVAQQLVGKGWQPVYGVAGVFALMAAAAAVMAVFPRNSVQKINGNGFNPLYFGHFTQLSTAQFIDHMSEILASEQAIHRAMLADIHGMGLVLARKHKFLRYSYGLFIAGMLIPVLVYLVSKDWVGPV